MSELQTVVITGVGVLAPQEGARRLEEFKIEDYITSQKTYLDRCSALALAGCALALRDAKVEWPVEGGEEFGLTLGTHLGCIETMKGFWKNAVEKGTRLANPLLFSHSYVNSPISLCAIEFGLKGYHATFCAGKNSGLEAVRAAFDAIRLGHAQAVLCGGVEALTATREQCESGDLGEGAAFFVLESAERAHARGVAGREMSDELWEAARASDVSARFGDCGGASGALALAQIVEQQPAA
jgi:3-oxoacyl-[acyl-carrier-protein] synthase II